MKSSRHHILWAVLLGFLAAYVLLFIVPVFLHDSNKMMFYRYVPTLPTRGIIGEDAKSIRLFVLDWLHGLDPYLVEEISNGVFYPPLVLLLLLPLGLVDAQSAYVLMLTLTLACFVALALWLPVAFSKGPTPIGLLFFATGLFSYGLQFELERGQYNDLPARVADEARRVTAGAATPYDKAVAIEEYLRQLPYDLNVQSPPTGQDAVDFLLFDLKRGYFDYQATAMALMLRTLGIPARVAVGYVLDPNEAEETRYVVRKDDAYTWVEVFFPRLRWVNFNPTQDRPAGGAGGIGSLPSDGGQGLVEPDDLSGLFDDTIGLPGDVGDALTEAPVIQDRGRAIPWILVLALAAVLAVLAAGGLAGRMAWNWGLSGVEPRSAMWEKVHRLARFTGFGSQASETPTEWSARLGSGIGRETEATQLAQAYEESRYGRPDLARADEEETRRSYLALRNALTSILLRRGQKPRK